MRDVAADDGGRTLAQRVTGCDVGWSNFKSNFQLAVQSCCGAQFAIALE
jgi:hypothetical protein